MSDRPVLPPLPTAAHGHRILAHRTVLPAEPPASLAALETAAAGVPNGMAARRSALSAVCADHPGCLDAWARLSQSAYAGGDHVAAYAFARVGYHRGLDRLRRHGWGGSGQVRWADPSNRGFLRALHALGCAAVAIGEMDEADRCLTFLLDLDPDDGIGVGGRRALGAGERLDASDLP